MDAISEYRNWKQQGEELRTQAKQAMEVRFRELLTEAARIAEDYKNDFSAPLKAPAGITAFRYKPAPGKAKKGAKKTEKAAAVAPVSKADPKTLALQKRRAQIVKKIEEAKGAGKPTRNLEDKLYEIDDEIRLATNAA